MKKIIKSLLFASALACSSIYASSSISFLINFATPGMAKNHRVTFTGCSNCTESAFVHHHDNTYGFSLAGNKHEPHSSQTYSGTATFSISGCVFIYKVQLAFVPGVGYQFMNIEDKGSYALQHYKCDVTKRESYDTELTITRTAQ